MLLALGAVVLGASPGHGQATVATAAAARPAPHATALRSTTKIVIDGRLDEPDWARAIPAKDFQQRDPDEGKPATEPTEVPHPLRR